MSPPRVPPAERLQILRMCDHGMSWTQIATQLGRNRRTITAIARAAGHTRLPGPPPRPFTEAEVLLGVLVATVGQRPAARLTGKPHQTVRSLARRLGVNSPLRSGGKGGSHRQPPQETA